MKIHSYAFRVNTSTGKELVVLCADPEEATRIYNKLKMSETPDFDPAKAHWVYADIQKAPNP